MIEDNHFEVFQSTRKILAKEEILNLFLLYKNQTFYADIVEHL